MKPMLIVKVNGGYALAPFDGEVPTNFIKEMQVCAELHSYSYGDSVVKAIRSYFEAPEKAPEEPVSHPDALRASALE